MQDPFEPEFDLSSDQIVEHIKNGLEAALAEKNLSLPDEPQPGFSEKNIKVQKLVYRAVENFNLPVIRTWYKYGQFQPYEALRPNLMQPQPLTAPRSEVPTSNGMRTDEIAIRDFFCDEVDLEQEWEQPLFEFLESNYTDFAEDKFRKIYLEHLNILEILEDISTDDDLSSNCEMHVERLEDASTGLWYEMENSPYFEEADIRDTRDFFDTLQMALISLSIKNNPTGPQISAVKGADALYHQYIWPLPAMRISVREARGPTNELRGEDGFTKQGEEYLDHWSETRPKYYKNWKSEVINLDLACPPNIYQEVKGKVGSGVGQLELATLTPSTDG